MVQHLRGDSFVAFYIAASSFRLLLFNAPLPLFCELGSITRRLRTEGGSRSARLQRSQSAAQLGARRLCAEGLVGVPPVLTRANSECERDNTHQENEAMKERDRAMVVSQPRPPDRVDAALEKVAPLRYLEAHECARSERTVTRYYHKSLS